MYVMGRNADGQLGLGHRGHNTTSPQPLPTPAVYHQPITALAFGERHAIFVAGAAGVREGTGLMRILGSSDCRSVPRDAGRGGACPHDAPKGEEWCNRAARDNSQGSPRKGHRRKEGEGTKHL